MPATTEDFLKAVLRSGLLSNVELQAALSNIPAQQQQNAAVLAEQLVRFGLLTQFQSAKLLQGASLGLKLGPYRILTPIGKGGMGMVYLGLDTRSHQHVAIKVLSPQRKREGDRHLVRFRREMEIAKDLLHPHLVISRDIGCEHDVHYLVMEYIPGQTLYRLVTTQGPLSAPRAAHLFSEVAAGLEYAHGKGLIHRDLKPANIMVTPNEHAKVLDLGMAMYEGEQVDDVAVLGGKGHVVGTFDYIAPEQTRDASRVDARADVYSLGCTLYFALTGKPPFPFGAAKEKIQAHRHQDPEPLHKLNPTVPGGFATLVRQLMAKQPDQRPASMTAVRTLLMPWAEAGKPFDQRDDTAFQAAIAALQAAPVPAEAVNESWAFVNDPSSEQTRGGAAMDPRFKMLVIGVAGVWTLAFVLLVLIFLLR